MAKTISRTCLKTIAKEAHQAAYAAVALFGDLHKFKLGFADAKRTCASTINGYYNYLSDFVPLSEMVVGKAIKNREPLRATRATAVERMVKQSFVGGKAWANGEVSVLTKDFMQPIAAFLNKWVDHLEVYAGIYENELTGTNVFGIYVKLKDAAGADHLTWEITIDDVDLVKPMTTEMRAKRALHSLFSK